MKLSNSISDKKAFMLLAAISCVLFYFTYAHWIEVWGDAGFNLYTFWQVAEGKLLYHDIFYFHGPLSPLFFGAIFHVFGTSILSVTTTNLFFTWLIACMIFSLLQKLFDKGSALVAAIYFLCTFAMAQNSPSQAWNFIFPYKPEAIHGTFLCFSAFLLIKKYFTHPQKILLFILGILWGCSPLISLEIFTALSTTLAVPVLLSIVENKKIPWQNFLPVASGAMIPLLLVIAYFWRHVSLQEALADSFSTLLLPLKYKQVFAQPVYKGLSGMDKPLENILSIGKASASIFALLWGLHTITPKINSRLQNTLLALTAALFIVPTLFFLTPNLWWAHYPKIFPVFLLFFLSKLAQDFWQKKKKKENTDKEKILLAFNVFSIVLLLKIFLNPRVGFYGFFVAMPAGMLLTGFFCSYWPKQKFIRSFFIVCICSLSVAHIFVTKHNSAISTYNVGSGADSAITCGEEFVKGARALSLTIQWVKENVKEEEKILFFPTGDFINYMARREKPIPYNFAFAFDIYGENFLLESVKKNPPEYIGFVTNNYQGLGFGLFGMDPRFGKITKSWADQNYTLVHTEGGSPFEFAETGMYIYRRNASTRKALTPAP